MAPGQPLTDNARFSLGMRYAVLFGALIWVAIAALVLWAIG